MKFPKIQMDNLMLILMLIITFLSLFSFYETRKLNHTLDNLFEYSVDDTNSNGEITRELNEENNHGDLR